MSTARFPYSFEKLSETVCKIVEDDPWKEYPFIYVVLGEYKNALIDTGCGSGDLRAFVEANLGYRVDKKELVLVNTHNHFDHVGANYQFTSQPNNKLQAGCRDLCAADADRDYTRSEASTLAAAVGARVRPYKVTRWLADEEEVQLGPRPGEFLRVLHTPGHTPDSLCLHYPLENRIFVGDLVYRWTYCLAVSERSDIGAYEWSCRRLADYIRRQPGQTRPYPPELQIRLSCGHVDANLEWYPTLDNFLELLRAGRKGAVGKHAPPGYDGRLYQSRDFSLSIIVGRMLVESDNDAESSSLRDE